MLLALTNCMMGSYIRIREIHWNTFNQATHNLTDKIMPEIIEYIDSIVESLSAVSERPGFDILCPVIPESHNLKEILCTLTSKVESCRLYIDVPSYAGINKELEDLIADLNKWVYLSCNS